MFRANIFANSIKWRNNTVCERLSDEKLKFRNGLLLFIKIIHWRDSKQRRLLYLVMHEFRWANFLRLDQWQLISQIASTTHIYRRRRKKLLFIIHTIAKLTITARTQWDRAKNINKQHCRRRKMRRKKVERRRSALENHQPNNQINVNYLYELCANWSEKETEQLM